MARPRFAPTGARTTPQFTPIQVSPAPGTIIADSGSRPKFQPQAANGFQSIGVTPRPAFTATEQAQLESAMKLTSGSALFELLASGKLTPQQQAVAAQISQRYNRPNTPLSVIGRALMLPTNISQGVAQAAKDVVLDGDWDWKDFFTRSPSFWLPQVVGRSFKEIPSAVWENKTYEDFLQENNDPNSFLYRHSMPIGLAMDIAFDPTTYLTVGATASSKTSARVILHQAYDSSFAKASKAIDDGFYTHANGFVEKVSSGEDVYQLAAKIHMIEGRPFTPGDAMDLLNKSDLALASGVRAARESGEKVSLRARQKAAFRSMAPRGGFGIRMAGKELVPPRYTDALAAKTRETLRLEAPTFTSAKSGLMGPSKFSTLAELKDVPVETFGKLSEDVLRTMLKETVKQIPRDAAFLTMRQVEDTRELFKKPPTAATATDAGIIARATKVVKSIMIEDTPYVPYEYRKGLLKDTYKAGGLHPYNKQLKEIKRVSIARKNQIIQQAKDMGWPDNQVKALEDKWDDLVARYEDPIDVVSRFDIHVGARIFSQQQIDSIFANPMFAAVVSEHTEDLSKALDEVNRITEHWTDVSKKYQAAKKAKKPKSLISRYENQLAKLGNQKHAANVEYQRLKQLQKSELAGKRVVADTTALTRRLGQDAVIETWRGKKYAVPQMVSDALREMRNPHELDKNLERALKTMNWTQNKWKILATSVNMSFHVMNLVGGMWNNMLGGTNNLFDYVQAYASILKGRADEAEKMSWAGKVLGRFSPHDPAVAKELHDFVQRSGAGGGMVHYDIYGEGSVGRLLTKEVGAERGKLIPTKARKALTATRRAYAGAAISTAVLPDEWVPDDVQDALNPMLGIGLLLPEAMRVGRHVASDVEDTLRTAPLIAAEKDQSLRQLLDAHSIMTPTGWGKYMGQEVLGLNRVQRETVWAIGARNALHYQFDYADLRPYEKYIAKTIFPFWVFYKNNFVLQAREVVNKPRYVNTFLDVQNYMNSQIGDNEDNPYFRDMLPEYFDKLSMFRVPVPNFIRDQLGIAHGQEVYLNPKLPLASLNLFPPLWEVANDEAITPTPQRWAQVLAPVFGAVGPMAGGGPIKPLLEYTVGYNLGLARPIDFQRAQSNDYRQSMTAAPGYLTMLPGPMRDLFGIYKDPDTGEFKMHASLKYIADQMASPFITATGDVASIAAGEGVASDKQKANALAWISGIRLTPVDPIKLQRSWLYRMENYLEAEKANAKFRGEELPREDDRLLRSIRAQLKVVERAYDAQQKDLFGGQP